MNYEKIKSIALAVLVLISILLTWSIWNYQPDYETIDNDYIYEVSISETRTADELIKPSKVLVHIEEEHHGTNNEKDADEVLKELKKWTFDEGENISTTLSEREFQRLVHGNNRLEMIFPTYVPFTSFKNILTFNNNSVPNAVFDRIVVTQVNAKENTALVYFVSTSERLVFKSEAQASTAAIFKKRFIDSADRWKHYFSYKLKNGHTIFLPNEETSLLRYKYYPDYIATEKFKDALFSDPSYVKKGAKSDGEEYTDGSSLLRVNYNNHMIFYVNPAKESEIDRTGNYHQLLEKSMNFVNEHSGWTDQYRLFDSSPSNPTINYRLFVSGRPVFNDQGMTLIQQVWGQDQIYKYVRPYFTLDISLPSEKDEVKLVNGKTAIDKVVSQDDINPNMIEDLTVGYDLARDPQTRKILVLEPSWYYKYNGRWQRLEMNEGTGGTVRGLE
ncbi:regulatory protein YycH of two-component signal transduction system YycFG [Bacillus ectoiniformans]|uniref:YycH family regulatory protein n=1 Tax=Bacillus ectoiniformans TaxID=1494429 RepID=UPI001959DAE0|nr:two-component system activity regulator YycH [Bacillus ectoiniformans]MBM7648163.1 regulatory protein YycH of two-component signal transduction system YycFG [Bacillus ectoiniformans]